MSPGLDAEIDAAVRRPSRRIDSRVVMIFALQAEEDKERVVGAPGELHEEDVFADRHLVGVHPPGDQQHAADPHDLRDRLADRQLVDHAPDLRVAGGVDVAVPFLLAMAVVRRFSARRRRLAGAVEKLEFQAAHAELVLLLAA